MSCKIIGHNWSLRRLNKKVTTPDKYVCFKCSRYVEVKTVREQEWEIDRLKDFKALKKLIFNIKKKLFKNPQLSRWTRGESH